MSISFVASVVSVGDGEASSLNFVDFMFACLNEYSAGLVKKFFDIAHGILCLCAMPSAYLLAV